MLPSTSGTDTGESRSLLENVEIYLARLKRELYSVSHSETDLLCITRRLAETRSDIQTFLNTSRPLLSLPTELLSKIMAFIPNAVAPPFSDPARFVWRVDLYDSFMVIPISQTCRRLREVALGCPALWTNLTKGPRTRARVFAQRSGGVLPLGISLPLGPVIGYHLGDIAKDFPSRVRDLHICDLHYDDTNKVRNLEHFTPDEPMPMLESLCVHFKSPVQPLDEDGRYRYSFVPPFTTNPEWVPKLRRLCLCSCDLASNTILASLTHLALHSIQIRRIHTRVENILSVCNALQFLHLDKLIDDNHLYGAPPGFSLPKPKPLRTCPHLRRISLRSMASYLASYISFLVSADQPGLALQLLHIEWPRSTPHLQLPGGVSRLTIGRYPTLSTQGEFRWWGMSACGSRHTLRTAAVTIEGAAEPLLRPDASAALADVRTLWLADVATLTSPGLYSFEVPVLKAVNAAFPILDTIVLANHFQSDWAEGGRPSLFLLADARSAAVQPRISTLRIVHGYGLDLYKQGDFVGAAPPEGHPLNLTRILAELASGAYDYLEHLVIEVPGHVRVDARQVARLRPHFKTTQVRVVDETPTMALPEYCVEPWGWPRDVKEPWPHRIW